MSIPARNEPPVALRRLLPREEQLTADELVAELMVDAGVDVEVPG